MRKHPKQKLGFSAGYKSKGGSFLHLRMKGFNLRKLRKFPSEAINQKRLEVVCTSPFQILTILSHEHSIIAFTTAS